MQVTDRIDPATPSYTAVEQGYDTAGRRWSDQVTTTAVAPTKAPPSTTATVRDPEYAGFDLRTGLIHLRKQVPAKSTTGQEYTANLTATALEDCADVVITDTIPDGCTYVSSEPPATREGNKLIWKFPSMRKGEVKNLKVTLKPDREGELVSCTTVAAVPQACLTTFVGKPVLTIDKNGPETALINSSVNYRVVVANKGTAVAKNVVVTDTVPEGLSSAGGQKTLSFTVGDLAPGQSKEIAVPLKADKTGKWCNKAVAKASNTGEVSDDACTTVLKPGVKIAKSGTKDQFIGRNATYKITVENIGDTTLNDVKVVDTAPAPTAIVSADGGTVSGNTVVWNVGSLAPKATKSFNVVLTSKVAGNYCNSASVSTADGLRESAQACTDWRGVGAVLLEVVDDPDPVQVGTTTVYTIRITNQGNADLHKVTCVSTFEDALQPMNSAQGKIEGQKVTFPTVPVLAPKASVTYTITVKGLKAADTRNTTSMNCEEISRPVNEEESTTVY
jgi:uncharacterized repeat protein (TIGR01451 family)